MGGVEPARRAASHSVMQQGCENPRKLKAALIFCFFCIKTKEIKRKPSLQGESP
jgi:hypothetical protein